MTERLRYGGDPFTVIPMPARHRRRRKERHLDRPEGTYTVEALPPRQRVKITGKVKTLSIQRIDNETNLDASELEAEEIIVLDHQKTGGIVCGTV